MNEHAPLITDYRFELAEDHHHPGSGRYGVKVFTTEDISPSFPYLNAMLDDCIYDHENCILIGANNRKRYAFRPHEIEAGMVQETSDAPSVAAAVVELVNKVWEEHRKISPSLRERKRPTVFSIYNLLPRKNCKLCGYVTCLAFSADLRNGAVPVDKCPPLSTPEYMEARELILALFETG